MKHLLRSLTLLTSFLGAASAKEVVITMQSDSSAGVMPNYFQ